MKQVLIGGSGEVIVAEVPAPVCPDGGILVRVTHSLISTGTEGMSVAGGGRRGGLIMRAVRNPQLVRKVLQKAAAIGVRETVNLVRYRAKTYMPTGYSAAGVVVEVGSGATGFRIGQRVACAGAGIANHAEVVAVPRNLAVTVPDGVSSEESAFVTLGAIAVQGLRRSRVQFGDVVLVVGLGLIGQLTVQLLKAAGCQVIGADVLPHKVEQARSLGLDLGVVLGAGTELPTACREFTAGHGVDVAVLTAATPSSVPANTAMACCRERGRVVVVGDVGMSLLREHMYRKELDFVISRSYGPGRYDRRYEEQGLDYPYGYVRWTENRNMAEFLRQIAAGSVQVRPLITEVFAVEQASAAYQRINKDRRSVTALLFSYSAANGGPIQPEERTVTVKSAHPRTGSVRVALIGAGAFAQTVHLPNLRRLGAELRAVASRSAHNVRQVGESYGAAYVTTDYHQVLADPDIDAVLIATRHNLRRDLIGAAAAAGKHIFVEKPLALTVEDAEASAEAVAKHGVLLTVGFNRRMAPCARALKDALASHHGPKMMHYRVNAGPLPADHWLYDPVEGGGRIRGEGVHFFDFLAWLCGEEPVSVEAVHARGSGNPEQDRDNLAAVIRFSGGSVGSILYACTGTNLYGKERVEVLAGGGVAVLDDFRSVEFAAMPGKPLRGKAIDKGQAQLLENFLAAVRGKAELAVTAADGVRATRMAVAAVQAASGETRP